MMRLWPVLKLPGAEKFTRETTVRTVAKAGMTMHEGAQVALLHEDKLGGDQRGQAVVHHAQIQTLEVRHVATDVERQDLPLAFACEGVATGKALYDQKALCGGISLPGEVLVGRNGMQPQWQAQQCCLFVWCERSNFLQLANKRRSVVVGGVVQDSLRWLSGGSTGLSAVSASGSDAYNANILKS
jgi:hypothetical protein